METRALFERADSCGLVARSVGPQLARSTFAPSSFFVVAVFRRVRRAAPLVDRAPFAVVCLLLVVVVVVVAVGRRRVGERATFSGDGRSAGSRCAAQPEGTRTQVAPPPSSRSRRRRRRAPTRIVCIGGDNSQRALFVAVGCEHERGSDHCRRRRVREGCDKSAFIVIFAFDNLPCLHDDRDCSQHLRFLVCC